MAETGRPKGRRSKAGGTALSREKKGKTAAETVGEVTDQLLGQTVISDFDPVVSGAQSEVPTPEVAFFPARVERTITTSASVSEIFNNLPAQKQPGEISKRGTGKKVIVDTDKMVFAGDFTEFDRAVLEAVLSQLAAGNRVMTPAMLFRTMSGKTNPVNVSPDMLKEVDEAISKCMYTPVILPIVNKENQLVQTVDGTVLNIIRVKRNVSGQLVQTYEVQSIPIIYQFCRAMGAVTYSPIEMLSVPMSMTKRSVAILNALGRYVVPFIWSCDGECMQAPAVQGEPDTLADHFLPDPVVISYDYIYQIAARQSSPEEGGGDQGSAQKGYSWFLMSKARETVATTLNYWVKQGYIRGWSNVTRGRKILSLKIEFFPIQRKYLPLPDMSSLPKLVSTILPGEN